MIDLNRGVMLRWHPTGAMVYMYFDEPGVFRTPYGNVIEDESFVAEAGYDVKSLQRERARNARRRKAMEEIDKDFEGDKGPVILDKRAGFTLVDIGLGRHNVVDPDGEVINKRPLTLPEANKVFASMVPEDAEVAEVADKPK